MRLLLAEDEKDLSRALCTILSKNNYTVDAVYDGLEALDYFDAKVYDAIILDIMMPKLDGIGVLKEIRRKKNNIPIIILTAKAEIDDKVEGLDMGANDYLTKPFDTRELLARLRVITKKSNDSNSAILEIGNTCLNRSNFELYTSEGSIQLNNKEFQLLELLLMNKDKIISTEIIMDRIWSIESEAELNVVWVYISYLRKKLQLIKSNVIIKVSRNLGYILEVKP